jgi:hypothetical protein
LDRNLKHFGRAEGCLFTTDTALQLFDYEGTTPHATRLINCTFDHLQLPNTTKSANSLLKILSNEKNLSSITNVITLTEFRKAFKKWNEGTSTSPSGRHLGHYRCLFRPDNCDKLYNQQYQDPNKKILQAYYNIIKVATHFGISLHR